MKSMPQDSQSSVRYISPLVISSGVVANSVSMHVLSKHTLSWFCFCAAVRKKMVNPMIISAHIVLLIRAFLFVIRFVFGVVI